MRKVREELRTGCVTGHVRTEVGHEGSLPPELTYTNVNAHRHLIQHLITPGSSIFLFLFLEIWRRLMEATKKDRSEGIGASSPEKWGAGRRGRRRAGI